MSIKLIETKELDGIIFKNYLLENKNGAKAEIISYGARIHKLIMPDIKGSFLNVIAGFENK